MSAVVTVAAVTGLVALATPPVAAGSWRAGAAGAGAGSAVLTGFGTALPAAWEICVLEDVGAHVTPADVADLDEWQIGEGGSTENDNVYNPFNTMRDTDASGNALPATFSPDGFPSFGSWTDGCAATAATILQPNMAPILGALRSGDVSPPAAYLSVVDSTPWCAPDNGLPCYTALIALNATPPFVSKAMGLLADSRGAIGSYDHDVAQVVSLQDTLAGQEQELVVAETTVAAADQAVQAAAQSLRALAVYDYTSNPSLDRIASILEFESPTQGQLLQQFYERVDLTGQVDTLRAAVSALHQAQAHQSAVEAAIAATQSSLSATRGDEGRWVARLTSDIGDLHGAGGCPGVPGLPGSGDVGGAIASLGDCLASLGA